MNMLPSSPMPPLRALRAAAFALVCLSATVAFAQTGPALGVSSSAAPALSTGLAITMGLSLLAGLITQAVQSGKIFGQVTTPTTWLPTLTTVGSFVAGIVGYLSGLPTGFTVTGAVAFYALAAGILHLETANVAGRTVNAHILLPAKLRAMRAGPPPAPPNAGAVGALTGVLVFVLALAAGISACTAQQAKSVGQTLVTIAVDACQEAPQLVPAGQVGTVVGLICAAVDATAPGVEVLIDAKTWAGMKAAYLTTHPSLPAGMAAPGGGK
jgi:hypothetical protein